MYYIPLLIELGGGGGSCDSNTSPKYQILNTEVCGVFLIGSLQGRYIVQRVGI